MDIPNKETRFQTICLCIISAFVICFALYFLKPVLIPFILALFLTYSLTPIIDFLMKFLKCPRGLAVFLTILLGLLLLTLFSILITASINQITAYAGDYQSSTKQLIRDSFDRLPLERFGIEKEEVTRKLLETSAATVGNVMKGTVSGFLSVLSSSLLVIIFMIFLLIGKQPPKQREGSLLFSIESRIRRYVVAMFLISTTTGVLVGFALFFLKVKFAFVFGFLAVLLNFIPNIGSIIATLLPLPVVLLNSEMGMVVKVLAFVIPGVIQFGIGNVLAPKVMGESLELHPIAILMALIFFGMIWGIVGMFLAVPITAVIKIILARIEYTQVVSELMSGRIDAFSSSDEITR